MAKAIGIAVKAEGAIKSELDFEFRTIREDPEDQLGYYGFYADPKWKKIYSWYKIKREDPEPLGVREGHDECLLMIDEKSYKDHTVDVKEEVEAALEKITLRLKELGFDIKDFEMVF